MNADILQQALENSGLPSVNVGGEQEGTEDANGNAVQVPVSLSQTISTMAVHDAVTGSTKRHTIRKVSPFANAYTLVELGWHIIYL